MLNKIAPFAAVAVLLLGGAGVASASVNAKAAAKPKAYGYCANAKTGAWRMMLPLQPRKSQWGTCKSGEVKYLLPTRNAIPVVPPVPATVIFKRGTSVETCTKTTDTVLTYTCTTVVPSPSPTPTPAS